MENTSRETDNALMIEDDDGPDLMALWNTLWQGKWLIVGITAFFTLSAVIYALTATQWYRAEVLLAPASTKSAEGLAGQLGNLGGLASLAGINVGGGNTSEPLAVLRSRDFARAFIEEQNLLPVFFASDWDAKSARWTLDDPKDWPDVRDGVKYFSEEIRGVQEDKKTGLITLSIEWKNAKVAADWANLMVDRVNDSMRARALAEAQANVNYLQHELAAASILTLQQSIGRLLDNELQKLMVARGKKEFAFRVIDRAEPPKWRVKPQRAILIILGFILGLIVSVIWVFVAQSVRRARSRNS